MLYGAGRQRRDYRRALLDAALGALLASQLNNLMPAIIGAFLDGAGCPLAIEPLQVIVITGGEMVSRCFLRFVSFTARCRHSTRGSARYE